jgi:hypothetical protein
VLGIPHPTGYPFFIMVGHFFTRMDFGVLASQPIYWNNSAFKVTLFVILTGLLHLWVFWRIHISLQEKLGMSIGGRTLGSIAAAFGALGMGTGHLYWSQSIVPEVYMLNLLFVDLTLLAMLSLMLDKTDGSSRWKWLVLGLFGGLGLFHHLSFLLFMPGFLILGIFCLRKPVGKEIIYLAAGFLLSLLPLLYLPIRSAQNPPIDTTNTENWCNFWAHISGRAYWDFLFKRPLDEMFKHLRPFDLQEQYGYIGILFIYAGIIGGYLKRGRLAGSLLALFLTSTALVLFQASNYYVMDRGVFFLPAFFAMSHLIALGISFTMGFALTHPKKAKPALRGLFTVILLIIAVVWQAGQIRHAFAWNIDVSEILAAKAFGSQAFADLEEDAIVLTWYDGQSYSLMYHRFVLFRGIREDIDIIFVPQIHTHWWWENVEDGNPDVELSIPYTGNRDRIVVDIIRTNIGKRPIYTAWPQMPIPDNYKIICMGRVFKIITVEDYNILFKRYHDNGDDTA